MKPKLALALIAAAVLVAPATAKADVVTSWNRTMIDALETAKTPPPPPARVAAIVKVEIGHSESVRRLELPDDRETACSSSGTAWRQSLP